MKQAICAGVIGSGVISEIYLKNMTTRFPNLRVKAVASKHPEHAKARADQFGLVCCTVDELLADPEIDLVVNLTPVGAHYEIVKAALEAGKHVYTEKTLTDDLATAAELVALAQEKGLYLGSAPETFLGSCIQTARAVLEAGTIGEVTGFVLSVNRDWQFLMNLLPFLREKGPGMCYDFAVYYVTALVSLLGPAETVAAFVSRPKPYHFTFEKDPRFGEEMICPNETRVSASIRLRSGVTGTMMMNGDSIGAEQPILRIYGTEGILELGDPNQFGMYVRVMAPQKGMTEFTEIPHVNPYSENSRGIGPADMARAILSGTPTRVDARMAYHVMEILTAILESGEKEQFVKVTSDFAAPEALRASL